MAADLRCRRMAYLCSKQPEQGPQVRASWWFVAGGQGAAVAGLAAVQVVGVFGALRSVEWQGDVPTLDG